MPNQDFQKGAWKMIAFSKMLTSEKKRKSSIQKKALENQALLEEIRRSESALTLAYSNFEHMVEPALIDCSIYELKAAQMRYQYLLEKAKKFGIQNVQYS